MTGRPAGVDAAEVRAHYRELADSYERGANAACNAAYREAAARWLGRTRRLLELGSGSSCLVGAVEGPTRVACDLSLAMLGAADPGVDVALLAADAQRLPCGDGTFDGILSVNLIEHVASPAGLLAEMARVLAPGGRALIVTPNGDHERLLDWLERLHLKLPEGPHRFLTPAEAGALARARFEVVEHRPFLAFPAGPRWLVRAVDRLVGDERGLFQYLLLRRPVGTR